MELFSGDTRIRKQVAIAAKRMGLLPYEEAFWVLIPADGAQEPLWVSAIGQDRGGIPSSIRLPVAVMYDPAPEKVRELLAAARSCDWVLHVHNHPREPYPGSIASILPSQNDFGFACCWRDRLPEVAGRMRFFIVQGDQFVEYTHGRVVVGGPMSEYLANVLTTTHGRDRLVAPPRPGPYYAFQESDLRWSPTNPVTALSPRAGCARRGPGSFVETLPRPIQTALTLLYLLALFGAVIGFFVFLSWFRRFPS